MLSSDSLLRLSLTGVTDGEIHSVGIVFAGEERQFVLLFPRLPVHHQDDPRIRTRLSPQDSPGLPRPHPTPPGQSAGEVLRAASGADTAWTEDLLCRDGEHLPADPAVTGHLRLEGVDARADERRGR